MEVDSLVVETLEDISIAPVESVYFREALKAERIVREDDSLYSSDNFFPRSRIAAKGTSIFRGQEIAHFRFYPVQFNPRSERVKVVSYISFRVTFKGAGNESGRERTLISDAEEFLKGELKNYGVAKVWRERRSESKGAPLDGSNPFEMSRHWYTLELDESDIYKVDYDYLSSSEIPVTEIDPREIRLFYGGGQMQDFSDPSELKEIPIRTYGFSDGEFNRGDYFLFWGQKVNFWDIDNISDAIGEQHLYETKNVYWLTYGNKFSGSPDRMREVTLSDPSDPGGRQEYSTAWKYKEMSYDLLRWSSNHQRRRGWYWTSIRERTFSLDDSRIVPMSEGFISVAPSEPTPSLEVNSSPAEYDGTNNEFEGVFESGGNSILISYPSEKRFEGYSVRYKIGLRPKNKRLSFLSLGFSENCAFRLSSFSSRPYVFDVTDPFNVRYFKNITEEGDKYTFIDSLTPRRYFVVNGDNFQTPPTDLKREEEVGRLRGTSGCEYLIIHPKEFDVSELEEFREDYNDFDVISTTLQQVYNEFSWGLKDVMAIKLFLEYVYRNWEDIPLYVVFVGDGNYDYREILDTPASYFPPCEMSYYYSDDSYLKVDSNEIQFACGRIPVRSQQELDLVIDKIKHYDGTPSYGKWKNKVVITADDEYHRASQDPIERHIEDSEDLRNYVYKGANEKLIYLIEYPRTSNYTKPAATEALINTINNGALVMNWMGHGNYHLLSHEDFLDSNSDLYRLNNGYKLPFFQFSSCEVGKFYHPFKECMAEKLVRLDGGGTIASSAATGMTGPVNNANFNDAIYKALFTDTTIRTNLGRTLLHAKLNQGGHQYVFFGDPAVRLAAPKFPCVIDSMTPESLLAGQFVNIYGAVYNMDTSDVKVDFNGKINVRVLGAPFKKHYQSPEYDWSATYEKNGKRIFEGEANVVNGQFQLNFFVNNDISLGEAGGEILLYAHSSSTDGYGYKDSLYLGISESNQCLSDSTGPSIEVKVDNEYFQSGDLTSKSPEVHIVLTDEHGINITNKLGHKIEVILDGDYLDKKNLSNEFSYFKNSGKSGELVYQFEALSAGQHRLKIKCWDNCGNSSYKQVEFKVQTDEMKITNILPYPNPFQEDLEITFQLSRRMNIEAKVFTLSGKLVKKIEKKSGQPGFNKLYWNGLDRHGSKISNGTYILKLIGRDEGDTITKYSKIVKMNK